MPITWSIKANLLVSENQINQGLYSNCKTNLIMMIIMTNNLLKI